MARQKKLQCRDPGLILEKEVTIYSSNLDWTEEPGSPWTESDTTILSKRVSLQTSKTQSNSEHRTAAYLKSSLMYDTKEPMEMPPPSFLSACTALLLYVVMVRRVGGEEGWGR